MSKFGSTNCLLAIVAALFIGAITAWLLAPPPYQYIRNGVNRDLEYFSVAPVVATYDLGINLYYPQKFATIRINGKSDTEVPVFIHDSDVFIYLWKGMSESGGIAISNDPNFIAKTERLESSLHIDRVDGNLFDWHYDGEGEPNGHFQ